MKKQVFYFKIILVLVLAFFISRFSIKNVFIANSPRVRPGLTGYLATKVINFFNNNTQLIAKFLKGKRQQSPKEALRHLPLRPVAKGVYAASEGTNSYTLIKASEVEWVEYTYTIKGRQIKIKIPAGQQPLPQQIIEQIYK